MSADTGCILPCTMRSLLMVGGLSLETDRGLAGERSGRRGVLGPAVGLGLLRSASTSRRRLDAAQPLFRSDASPWP